jgi:hypothetical protein
MQGVHEVLGARLVWCAVCTRRLKWAATVVTRLGERVLTYLELCVEYPGGMMFECAS